MRSREKEKEIGKKGMKDREAGHTQKRIKGRETRKKRIQGIGNKKERWDKRTRERRKEMEKDTSNVEEGERDEGKEKRITGNQRGRKEAEIQSIKKKRQRRNRGRITGWRKDGEERG